MVKQMKAKVSKQWPQDEESEKPKPTENYFRWDRKELAEYERQQEQNGFRKEIIQLRPGLIGYIWRHTK